MIATATGKLLQVVPKSFTDKKEGREVKYFVNTVMTNEGVIAYNSGNDYTPLVDKQVLLTIQIDGLEKVKEVKLIKLEEFTDEGVPVIDRSSDALDSDR